MSKYFNKHPFSYRNKPLSTKTGLTRLLTEKQTTEIMRIGPTNKGVVTIKFKTEAEGVRLAKKYARLARNPSISLNVTFEKIN